MPVGLFRITLLACAYLHTPIILRISFLLSTWERSLLIPVKHYANIVLRTRMTDMLQIKPYCYAKILTGLTCVLFTRIRLSRKTSLSRFPFLAKRSLNWIGAIRSIRRYADTARTSYGSRLNHVCNRITVSLLRNPSILNFSHFP